MALDYSARRQVSRNRPKKRPVRLFVLMILGGVSAVYGLGIATGWVLSRTADKIAENTASPTPPPAVAGKSDRQGAANPSPAPGPVAEGGETPLTFFNTLPKGDKEIMGSGINLHQVAKPSPAASTAPQTVAAEQKPQQTQNAVKADGTSTSVDKARLKHATDGKPAAGAESPSGQKTAGTSDQRKQGPVKTGYTVQVASYEQKNEADDLKTRLEKQGLSARVVETKVPGKGVRYRVRVGRGMEQDGAQQLAAKLGKNALIIPE